MWIRAKEIKEILGLSNQALYERRKRNSIKHKKINGIYFYWLEEDINALNAKTTNSAAIYCRVSTTAQKQDLEKQEKILKEHVISAGYAVNFIFSDIASGMNENRKGLNGLIEAVVNSKINKVFISYKDRLTRFGFGYFEEFFKKFGVEIVVVNLTKEEDFQTELTQDLISIIHYFSMKMYSNRRKELNKLKKALKE